MQKTGSTLPNTSCVLLKILYVGRAEPNLRSYELRIEPGFLSSRAFLPQAPTSAWPCPNVGLANWNTTLRSPRFLLVAASLTLVAAAALNWSWLAAIGLAPLLLSVLPCIGMCALGLCMSRMPGSCERSTDSVSSSAVAAADDRRVASDLPSRGHEL